MSEHNEVPMGQEREAGIVSRVGARIGKFLSETYTFKGAAAKEQTEQYAKIYNQFSGETKAQMMRDYEKVATDKAHWKVIRNWIATGAGLALGFSILHNPTPVWEFLTKTAPEAIKGGVKPVFDWMFHIYNVKVVPGSLELMKSGTDTITKALPNIKVPPLNLPWLHVTGGN